MTQTGSGGWQGTKVLLTVLLVQAGFVRAGTNTWTSIGPDGGNVYDLAVDPRNSQTVYATTGTGLFKTTDGGANWSALRRDGLPGPPVLKLVIDPRNPSTLYGGVAGPGGLFRSDDGGMTWNQAGLNDAFFPISSLAIDPQDPQTLYAGMRPGTSTITNTGTGLFKTTDGGQTWMALTYGLPALSQGSDVKAILVDPHDSRTVYAGYFGPSIGGVYKSADGGINWRAVNSGLVCSSPCSFLSVNALAADPQNSNTVYASTIGKLFKSTNGGASWTEGDSGLPFVTGSVSIAIDPQNPNTLYLAWQDGIPDINASHGVFKSVDGARTWARTGLNDSVAPVVLDPQNPSILYAGNSRGRGIYKSTDGANTWNLASAGLHGGVSIYALAVAGEGPSAIYAATPSGVFKSMNGGASWNSADSGLSPEQFGFLIGLYGPNYPGALAVDPRDTGTLYAGILSRGVFKTLDGGANWSYTGLGGTSFYEALVIDPQNPGTVYAAGFSEQTPARGTAESAPYFVFKTTDGGGTWAATGAFPNPAMLLAVDPQKPSHLYAATWDKVFTTTDAGGTWSELALPDGFIDPDNEDFENIYALVVDPQDSQTVYVSGYKGLLKSSDAGQSWRAIDFGLPPFAAIPNALIIDPQDSNVLYASVFGPGILRSSDGGASRTDANFGSKLPDVRTLVIDPGDPSTQAPVAAAYSRSQAGPTICEFSRKFSVFGYEEGCVWGAKPKSLFPTQPLDDTPLAAPRPRES